MIGTIEERSVSATAHSSTYGPGLEFITNAEHEWSAASGCSAAYISPGSPLDNSFVESFTSRYRDESLNSELFISAQGAKLLAEQNQIEYCT